MSNTVVVVTDIAIAIVIIIDCIVSCKKTRGSLTCVQCLSLSGSPPRVFLEFSLKHFSIKFSIKLAQGQQEEGSEESLPHFWLPLLSSSSRSPLDEVEDQMMK